jgi:hypothetical protein
MTDSLLTKSNVTERIVTIIYSSGLLLNIFEWIAKNHINEMIVIVLGILAVPAAIYKIIKARQEAKKSKMECEDLALRIQRDKLELQELKSQKKKIKKYLNGKRPADNN